MSYRPFGTAREGFTASLPKRAKQLMKSELGRAKTLFAGSMRSTGKRFWVSQRAGVTLTALVMLGMLLASPLVAILGGQSAAAPAIGVIFDRQLSGDRVGQHKAPPFAPVTMTITATVSNPIDDGVLIDYFPNEWSMVDAKGGAVSVHDKNYNKVEWNVGAVSDSVSRSYVVRSPQLTSPPTKYYFHSELTYGGGGATSDDWMVIVADPTTYDYPTGAQVDKWAYKGEGSSPPADGPDITGQAEVTDYTLIESSNDVRDSYGPAAPGRRPYFNFKFTISETPSDITQLDLLFEGYPAAAGATVYLRLWNFGTLAWDQKAAIVATGGVDENFTATVTTLIENYINASGYLYFLTQDGTNKGTLYCDYVKVDVTVAAVPPGKPVLYLPENATSTYDNTPYFEWTAGSDATSHRLVIDNDTNFADGENIYDNANLGSTENSITIENELPPDNYYWKVAAINAQGENWSENTWTFEVVVGAWDLIEIWTGTVEAPATWQLIETWTGTIEAPAEWQLIESWAGTISAPAEWQLIETWSGAIESPVEWQLIEEWTGTISAPAVWNLVETWTGTTSAPVQWQLIETWTGTIETPVVGEWQLIETWTGIIEVPAEWQLIETWTRTIQASAEWQLTEAWTGIVEAPVEWKLIETWLGAIEALTKWQLIEGWAGTINAPAVWDLIESWTGAVEAPVAWQLIETWMGAIEAGVAQWDLIETWTGTIRAPATWQIIETWIGTVRAPIEWQIVETWTGTIGALAEWQLIETWTGVVEAPAEWQLIETWIGTIEAPAVWQLIKTWTGTIKALAEWQLIETWTGTVEAFAGWQLIETWMGAIEAGVAQWDLIETWTGTIRAPATWQIIETWIGTVRAPIEWQIVETWTGTIGALAEWQLIETWTGVVEASAEWQLIEAWTGVVEASAKWKLIETWSGAIRSPVEWQLIEEWLGTVSGPAVWDLIESWTGVVKAPVAWQLIETWIGTVEAPAAWQLIETWSGAIESPVEWQLIEEWLGTVSAQAMWNLIESWTGAVKAPVAWQLIETWVGTVEAPAAWQLIETWTGTIEVPAAWQLIETWTGTIESPAAWQLVETWTGTVEAPAAWQLIDTWTGVIGAPVYPSKPTLYLPADGSITNDNTPYFEWTLGTNADNHRLLVDNDPDFTLPEENVLLGATDNTYTPTAELADENYSWKVIAINAFGENESTVWTFIIDTAAPAAPSLLEPTDGSLTNDNTPTFRWTLVTDPSEVTYTVQVDNDSDFTSPEVNVSGLTENTYTPSALADENYSWRVRAVDGANNVGAWSSIWTLLVDTSPPPQVTLISPTDGTKTNDNTPTFTWDSISDPSSLTYTIQVDNDSDFTSPEVNVSGLTENSYTPSALADENYSWHVRAVDGAGNSGNWSTVWTLLIDTAAPAAPSPLEPADGSLTNDNTPTLRWTEVIDASGVTYTIQADNDSDFSSPEVNVSGLTENSYTPSALADENYSWHVRAVDGANNAGNWSTTWTFVIDIVPPSTPALQSPADGAITNDNTPTFDWSDVAGAENYDFLVDNDADFSSPEIQVTVPISTRTPTAGLPDENYSWKVRARDAANNVSDYSSTWTLLIDTVPPDIPTLQSPADGTITNDNTPTFDWLDVADAVEYRLQVDNDPDFSSPEINVLVAISTYTPTSELADENYSWRGQARDSANNWSPWSSVWTLVVAVKVRAVDVSVSPSWQENIAGGLLSYVVVVTNLGEVADDLDLSVSDALGWSLSFDNTRFENVENGGSRSTTLRVTIPGIALPSQTDNITVTVTSGGDPSKSDSENCQAHVALPRDVEVEISPSSENGSPGDTLPYIVTVKNTSYLNDMYKLTASDNLGWVLYIWPMELWIEAGDNDIALLSVTIPLETVSSITDNITVRAKGTLAEGTSTDPENVSAENTAEARCTVVRDVDVSISPSYQSGLPGTLLTYTVTVTNTGNALDTYELTTSDNSSWSPVVSPSSIALSPSASGNATLKVIVPLGAISCTRDNIIVTATSQLDITVSSSASSIAHAVTITNHDPIHIVGNDNFTEANGVISGSGTLEDPYIIGYWDIDTSSAHGIWIENTDVYFIIRNNLVYGNYKFYGVYFNHVKNGKIESVTNQNNNVGIYLKNSSNNIIEKCTTSNNFIHGIYLNSSDNNIISESNASNNTNGIYLQSSSNNRIEKCTASNNDWHGIFVEFSSENNRIYHNSFKSNFYQAWDEGSNLWDNDYPSGGNYWSDYPGTDNYRGENQDIPGSDEIGDTPYYILGDNNLDRYPLITRSFELSISPSYRSGLPGTELSYTVTLTNTGNVVDNWSLTVSDNAGWGPTITPSTLNVNPSQSKNAILEVTIPENAENSDRNNILVVARSQTDNTVSASASCIAHAEIIRRVEVLISPEESGELPRENVTFIVMVTNIGNIVDNYDLTVIDNLGWDPTLSENSLENVQPSDDRTVTLRVSIPENAEPGTRDSIIVTAVSQTDPEVSDNDSCIAYVFSPKAEFSLVTLYEVSLDMNLWLENGPKLVAKFYKYDNNTFQGENVIDVFVPPKHVENIVDIPHPLGVPVEIVTLFLTTDNTENVISTLASFVVRKVTLETRFTQIPLEWSLAPPEEKVELEMEFMEIPVRWALAPS